MTNEIEIIRGEFRRSEEARYIHRLHGVLLVLSGLSTVKVGKLLGDPQRTISHWVIRFKEHGLKALNEEKLGRPEILNSSQKKLLMNALAKPPKEFGLKGDKWTGAFVASFMLNNYGIKLTTRHCHRLLVAFKNQNQTDA